MKDINKIDILINSGIEIKAIIDSAIKAKDELYKGLHEPGYDEYPKEIFEWMNNCNEYLENAKLSKASKYEFTQSDNVLLSLRKNNGETISYFSTPYDINKSVLDISEIIHNKINFLKSLSDDKQNINEIKYTFDTDTSKGRLSINKNTSILFEGRTAKIIEYFYQIRNTNKSDEYRNYKDFNNYLNPNDNCNKISSQVFAQTIKDINKNVTKKIPIIQELISLRPKNQKEKTTSANLYKWVCKLF